MSSADNLTPGNISSSLLWNSTFFQDDSLLNDSTLVLNWTEIVNGSERNVSVPFEAHVGLRLWEAGLIATFLSLFILLMVVGNLFVILAILLERDLQRPQYYLILSLAVADLLVGVVVSPLATVYEVERQWSLGVELCDFWISMDVMACTSSILHLVAIALDRYWSITDIMYIQKRTPRRIGIMLICVWVVSIVVSVAPMLGWKGMNIHDVINTSHFTYLVPGSRVAFYGPLLLIIVLYYQIFKAAKRRIRKTRQKRHSATITLNSASKQANSSTMLLSAITVANNTTSGGQTSTTKLLIPKNAQDRSVAAEVSSTNSGSQDEVSTGNDCNGEIQQEETVMGGGGGETESRPRSPILRMKKRRSRESPEAKRERKAWRTLVIITGSFVACWLPFFILAIARPICKCNFNPIMESVFLWLGYLNSALNPLIYTIFSPDFRNAFKKLGKKLCFVTF